MDDLTTGAPRIPDVPEDAIREAASRFDESLRDTAEWQGWSEDPRHKWALVLDERLYPVKEIIRQATGATDFSGGDEANGYLERKGFTTLPLRLHATPRQSDVRSIELETDLGFPSVLQRILGLQAEYSSLNTPSMQLRGELIRNVGPRRLRELLRSSVIPRGDSQLSVEGRDGTGRKTRVPWIRVFSDQLAPSATDGWYVVYLFSYDGHAVYLSLNQGTTTPTGGQFQPKPAHEIAEKVAWARGALGLSPGSSLLAGISLDADGLGRGYEAGNVASIQYRTGSIPGEEQLAADLSELLSLLGNIYELEPTRNPDPPAPGTEPPPEHVPEFSFEDLVSLTLWDEAALRELVDALRGDTYQLVLAGPPGTGKTWVAKQIVRYLTQDTPGLSRMVQFHPSYSYEQFVEGLRPSIDDSKAITFDAVPGVILEMAAQIQPGSADHFLIIDEMNRANLPRVLGEMMFLFEYREEKIDLPYTRGFQLPAELRVIGTMNTADRSIRSIDVALRRRFDIFSCLPDPRILRRYYLTRHNGIEDLVEGFDALNERLSADLDPYHTIGHTFFMAPVMDASKLRAVWDRQLFPLMQEYFFDQPDRAESYRVEELWPSLRED